MVNAERMEFEHLFLPPTCAHEMHVLAEAKHEKKSD